MKKRTINIKYTPSRQYITAIVAILLSACLVLKSYRDTREYIASSSISEAKIATERIESAESTESTTIEIIEPSTPIPEPQIVEPKADVSKILAFVESYPGSRIDRNYLVMLDRASNGNIELIKQIVAIATAETGQGRDTTLENNFFGWHAGGNRYHDPDREEMAIEIVNGIGNHYQSIGAEGVADIYTGGDSTSNWLYIYNWSLEQMN